MLTGRCLCGDITFEVTDTPKEAAVCHCTECRRQTGHAWAEAFVDNSGLTILGELKWYAASPIGLRGFCPRCGSFLFWKGHGEDRTAISLGALDLPTGLKLEKHIYVAEKGDYYDIADGLPQEQQQD